MKKTNQKQLLTGQIINVRKTHRNEPCPCGKTKIIVDQYKQEFVKPMKFKHCCLD